MKMQNMFNSFPFSLLCKTSRVLNRSICETFKRINAVNVILFLGNKRMYDSIVEIYSFLEANRVQSDPNAAVTKKGSNV